MLILGSILLGLLLLVGLIACLAIAAVVWVSIAVFAGWCFVITWAGCDPYIAFFAAFPATLLTLGLFGYLSDAGKSKK